MEASGIETARREVPVKLVDLEWGTLRMADKGAVTCARNSASRFARTAVAEEGAMDIAGVTTRLFL